MIQLYYIGGCVTINVFLKRKIKEKYGTISKFCEQIGYSYAGVYRLMSGERGGNIKFWKKVKIMLRLTDKELWECMMYHDKKNNIKK